MASFFWPAYSKSCPVRHWTPLMGNHNSGQPIPVSHHPHCEKCPPCIQSKSFLFQLITIVPCSAIVSLGKNKNVHLYHKSLLYIKRLEYGVLRSFCPGWNNFDSLSLFNALLRVCSERSMSCNGDPRNEWSIPVRVSANRSKGESTPSSCWLPFFCAMQKTMDFLGCKCRLSAQI